MSGLIPTVRAYQGPLCFQEPVGTQCADEKGIQFETPCKPDEKGPPGFLRWFYDEAPRQFSIKKIDEETIALPVKVTKLYYGED
jgi:hypothetical protein